jgi:hypothetical protein
MQIRVSSVLQHLGQINRWFWSKMHHHSIEKVSVDSTCDVVRGIEGYLAGSEIHTGHEQGKS